MNERIGLVGSSTVIKLLRDSLRDRGIEVFFWEKARFKEEDLPEDLKVLVYELSIKGTKADPHIMGLLKRVDLNILVLAEEISLDEAIGLIRSGVRDVKLLSAPLELLEKSVLTLIEECRVLQDEGFVTHDPKMLKILSALEEVAKTKAPVLLVGESGTGKEMLARYIHSKSDRKGGPFVAINCSALPESLLESELFGYEKGAFSGALFRKKGKIELADKGTLLLDEITEMSPNLQSKLLRVLQEGEVDRLGGYHPIKVDFRLISTTNRDIEKEVAENRFRLDLYYRINVITVKVPPLRDRRGDVKLLTQYFLEKFSLQYRKKIKGLTDRAWNFLNSYPFPGNVRELRNMIERGVITCDGELIDVVHLTDPFGEISSQLGTKFEKIRDENRVEKEVELKPLEEMEREAILKALELTKGNRTKAAELLGITVRTLRNKLKQYEEMGLLKF